jgi:hypothetical protein
MEETKKNNKKSWLEWLRSFKFSFSFSDWFKRSKSSEPAPEAVVEEVNAILVNNPLIEGATKKEIARKLREEYLSKLKLLRKTRRIPKHKPQPNFRTDDDAVLNARQKWHDNRDGNSHAPTPSHATLSPSNAPPEEIINSEKIKKKKRLRVEYLDLLRKKRISNKHLLGYKPKSNTASIRGQRIVSARKKWSAASPRGYGASFYPTPELASDPDVVRDVPVVKNKQPIAVKITKHQRIYPESSLRLLIDDYHEMLNAEYKKKGLKGKPQKQNYEPDPDSITGQKILALHRQIYDLKGIIANKPQQPYDVNIIYG